MSCKLKEHSFKQDERNPCLFVNEKLDFGIGVHVDDMLAVRPNDATKTLLQGDGATARVTGFKVTQLRSFVGSCEAVVQ